MFGLKLRVKCVTTVMLTAVMAGAAMKAEAQSTPQERKTRRETSSTRRARIARTIEDTYTRRWEVAGGGGYLRFKPGSIYQKNNEVTFWLSGTYYLNQKWGITGESGGQYGNAKMPNQIATNGAFLNFNPQISQYPFLGGITYRFYRREKFAISASALGGASYGKFDGGSKNFTSADLGLWETTTKPAFSLSASADYNFYPNLALRITPLYQPTFFRLTPGSTGFGPSGSIQNNFGVNVGFVYRFGRIK